MYTLGIETSCDETSAAVLKGYKVLSNITISSLHQHKKYGGVVPEIATRAHLANIDKVTSLALKESGCNFKRLKLVAVTKNPGLIGALVVGMNFAKALSLSLNLPLVGVNHLHAHLFAPFLNNLKELRFPFLGVVVSGGHSEFYMVKDFDCLSIIGQTRDDACGEVYDKLSVNYGFSYPGGPVIDRLYNPRYKKSFHFKCGKMGYDLSFSGIKTALIYKKKELSKSGKLDLRTKKKLLSSFQYSVIETIISTVLEIAKDTGVRRIVFGGGVVANSLLRQRLLEVSSQGLRVFLPDLEYSADNAAIVAGLGFYLYNKKGLKHSLGLKPESN
ncbi:MAG: tRNA (adenosine(37)-N6)-threonylcarbamoyltransferase complex transferase subunit TsaD [Candidatus Omnitrophica bacterium]|nr:tRNA (adenosine(37)-N6)-threonylcarbamoyltransferase complex transferase subunit TsaD [Candidatus Omnitrophota bacterium]